MKKFNLFVIAIVAMLGFSINAKAADGISLACEKTEIKINESTTCTVSVTVDNPIDKAVITLSTSRFLDVSNIVANTTAGWKYAQTSTDQANGVYSFTNTSGKSGQLFSFTVTLNSNAKELGEKDTCGELCISGARLGDITLTNTKGTGTCFAPTVVIGPPTTENPPTGAFANYAIIAVSILVAGAAVVIARKSTKFFRV